MQLTWSDLVIDDITMDDFQEWISFWSPVISGRMAPAFMSRFGTWFLRRPEGHIEVLDVFSGDVARIADTYEQFVTMVNETSWQEAFLLAPLVFQLHRAGKSAAPGQSYALAPHPALGGPNPLAGDAVDPRFVQLMDIGLWQRLCARFVLGAEDSPEK